MNISAMTRFEFPPTGIVVHCSDSTFGDSEIIDSWHLPKWPSGLGYHYVILNGRRKSKGVYSPQLDGEIEQGRPLACEGAHCRAAGQNRRSIGICMIGLSDSFTPNQLEALVTLTQWLSMFHGINPRNIKGHSDFDSKKSFCPGFDVQEFIQKRYAQHGIPPRVVNPFSGINE